MTETYWNSNGKEQEKCDAMEQAGWEYNAATKEVFHRYYRFHNDGDLPPRLRFLNRTSYCYAKGHHDYIAYAAQLEERMTQRIQIEYRRFLRAGAGSPYSGTATESFPA